MKKIVILSIIGLMSTGMFAGNVSVKFKITKCKTTKIVKGQYYDITCANGNTCHRTFNSLQAAYDYAVGFCQ
ncbi:hypothetical protein [Flavobacterium psychrophilum]|uniref:hypothetical protein n=1 Tax=Flavobacterium psychrophilum TaxID=96345 RepID=UPI000B7C3103|nr:hypothetical protein [Flavobacterium psychrophilum]EKT4498543.1 hypothetical protein [Flavobacterium psychrophilum]EKT4552579.1 hypothetical protein [Flavobacterium psychrophilum]ELM3649962.1 hypothetical protein [Flavobacterium psychrophilum]ELM3670942.1 hypothetical protein [Flavobacterium psychrophilum]ELM3725232.1 hypothetical protein [Flavobacterium psychrophilum]